MKRWQSAAPAVLSAAVVLALLFPAASQRLSTPGAVAVRNDRELRLFQAVLDGLTQMGADMSGNNTRRDPPTSGSVQAAAAVAPVQPPVPNLTAKEVGTAVASVLAAAAIKTEVLGTLGDPKPWTDGYTDGRVALYRLPPSGAPKGTCIFIHGCKHDPYSWFYKSDACPQCTGLPEEVAHSKQCLARGYAVLALMSKNRIQNGPVARCFASSGPGNDQPDAKAVIDRWSKRFKLTSKPKYMFGVSSGAAFAIKFPSVMQLQGIVSEVNMPDVGSWLVDSKGRFTHEMPPTVFYQMQRDNKTAQQINAAVQVFNNNKVPVGVIKTFSRPVTDTFLYERSLYISKTQSKQIAFFLRKIGVIDSNGFVNYDVRVSDGWTKELPKYLPWLKRTSPYYNLISDESQIWQELNLAWSWHEIVSDYVRPTLVWLEKKGKADLDALVKQYDLHGNLRCLTENQEGCA
ncbi:hypothetical protein ABPG77_006836 [Micractinium sp. CCAP 211/92]